MTVFSDKAGRWVTVVVSDKRVAGTPQSVDEETAVINGVEYRLGRDENGAALYKFDGITSGEYIIDAYDNLIGMIETGDEINYAYVTGVYECEESDSAFEVKMVIGGHIEKQEPENARELPTYLVGNKAIGLYEAAQNIKVNRTRTGYDGAVGLKDTFVKYKLDKDGKISHIETVNSEMILTDRSFNPEILSFGGLFYIDETTQVVCVPKNADIGIEDYYKQLILEKSQSYRIVGYDIDEDTKIAKAVFLNETMRLQEPGIITKSTKYSVVEKAGIVLVYGDPIYMIRVWNNGEQKELYSSGNAAVNEIIDGLKFGDCIYYSTNSLGEVDNVQLIAGIIGARPFVKNLRSENECIFGTLYTVKKRELSAKTNTEVNTFGVSMNGSGTDILEYTVDDTKTPEIYYIDTAQRSISPISVKELAAYSEFGDDAMRIFVAKKQYAVSAVVAVR